MVLKKCLFNFTNPLYTMKRNKGFFLPKVQYKQGQMIERNKREYFFYVDHDGRLYMDNSRMKNFTTALRDASFLKFFFDRIRINCTGRYEREFPFAVHCGRELNYVRCEDTPIVFTHHMTVDGVDKLSYNHIGSSSLIDFCPQKLYINPVSERLYHPAWEKVGNIGLVSSSMAQQLVDYMIFSNGSHALPTQIKWQGERLNIDYGWVNNARVYGLRSRDPSLRACDCER